MPSASEIRSWEATADHWIREERSDQPEDYGYALLPIGPYSEYWQHSDSYVVVRGEESAGRAGYHVEETISDAEWIVDLDDDWDEAGAAGYHVSVLDRARAVLEQMSQEASRALSDKLPMPDVNPAQEGSIDLFWRLEDRDLLMNVPVGDESISFFGRREDGNTISGLIAGTSRMDVIVWLMWDE